MDLFKRFMKMVAEADRRSERKAQREAEKKVNVVFLGARLAADTVATAAYDAAQKEGVTPAEVAKAAAESAESFINLPYSPLDKLED